MTAGPRWKEVQMIMMERTVITFPMIGQEMTSSMKIMKCCSFTERQNVTVTEILELSQQMTITSEQ